MRVLVTRPREQGEQTARQLLARGHDPVCAPLLTIRRTAEPAPSGACDALLVTSANAVPALASLVTSRAVPVYAVGPRTASLVEGAGFKDVRTADGDAVSLAALVRRSEPLAARLLHVAGRDRRPEPKATLVRAGFTIETWTAYEAVAAGRLPGAVAAALADERLDAALHYSRRSAQTLIDLAEEAGMSRRLACLCHVCLSPEVAAPLREHELTRLIVAPRPSEASLFAALALCGPRQDA